MSPAEWFARRTLHHRDFSDAAALARMKREQGLSVSVCIPTLNEEATIGPIVETIRRELVDEVGLVDELAIIDSSSTDATAEAASRAGAEVFQDSQILPDLPPLHGKGEALWKSLFALRGDLVLWLDADIKNFDPRFVCGPLGALLADPSVGYSKSFYRRPIGYGGEMTLEGGRVTELVARPLINMFWPHLAGLIQPLSGEYAGRREVLEQVPFLTGYGVEIGLLIDIADRFGMDAIAQVDLEERIHRNRTIGELSRMAFAVMHSALRRLGDSGRLDDARLGASSGLLQFEQGPDGYQLRPTAVEVGERPPAASVRAAR